MAPNYALGKVYAIHNTVNDKVYVGSTIRTLAQRMAEHRKSTCDEVRCTWPLYSAMLELGVDKFYIELLGDFPCERREQLLSEEGKHIREYKSISPAGYNVKVAGRKKDQYYVDNIEEIKKKKLQHYAENSSTLNAKTREYRAANGESLREKDRQHYAAHAEEIKCKQREYVAANRALINVAARKYYAAHKEAINARRKAAKEASNITPLID